MSIGCADWPCCGAGYVGDDIGAGRSLALLAADVLVGLIDVSGLKVTVLWSREAAKLGVPGCIKGDVSVVGDVIAVDSTLVG